MVAADNKMWEGHRIIYPNLRHEYVKAKESPPPRPLWDEQKKEAIDQLLFPALGSKKSLKLTLWSKTGIYQKEVWLLSKEEQEAGTLKCLLKEGHIIKIPLADILDIEL